MLRWLGCIIGFGLASVSIANAQSLTSLEVRTDAGQTRLDVATDEAVIDEGRVQLSAGTIAVPVLLDLQGAPAIAISSAQASTELDLVLISPNGTIVTIVRNASPGSQNLIALSGPVAGVLQLAGGSASGSGFEPGGTITHNILTNSSALTE